MSQNYLRRLYILLFCLVGSLAYGQEIRITTGGSVAACNATFVDGGGINGNHSPAGGRQVITICSDNSNPENTHVELLFTVIDIRGTLTLLNGNTENADTLTQITANNNSDRIRVTATAGNNSGCLTVIFESNGNKAGWEADVSCVAACQPIIAQLVSSVPAVAPAAGGYIDVCVGDEIVLTGGARYPENGIRYPQRDETSTFRWDFQDGTTATGKQVTKVFTEPGGYIVELDITDNKGCSSQNNIAQRVRVSAPPDFSADRTTPLVICPGESVTLGIGDQDDTDLNINATPKTVNFTKPQPFSERIDIPDQAGILQSSSIVLRDFEEGQVLTSGDGIVEICVDVEHSYAGDISMWVECPNGRRVDLLQYDPTGRGATNQLLGKPTANGGNPGEPFTYCWSADGVYTVPFYAQTFLSGPGGPATIPPEVTYLPLDGSFDPLAGCPLNGTWTLNVIDNQDQDDGTVFSWSIKFADNLVDPPETFTVPLISAEWADAGIHSDYSPQRITYTGENPGFANQRLVTLDSFGCRYDTLVPVRIRSPYSAACFSCPPPLGMQLDTTVCESTPFRPGLTTNLPAESTPVRWEAYTDLSFASTDAPPASPYESTLRISDQLPATISDPATDLGDICIDLSSSGDLSGLEASIVSPGGTRVVLIPRGTISGTNLVSCFTPDNSPRWAALRGARINGDWTLQLSDTGNGSTYRLTAWSVEGIRQSTITYSWSPVTGDLSCTDCPDPIITPTQSAEYFLTARNSDGCTSFSSIKVDVKPFAADFTAEYILACQDNQTGGIDLTPVTPLPNATYAWSNGATTQDLSGIPEGAYELTVTAENGCTATYSYDLEFPPPLTLSLDRRTDVSCAGGSDGAIQTVTAGGSPPYRYQWSDSDVRSGGNAGAVQAGRYTLTVTDQLGCSDSVTVDIEEPAPLNLEFSTTPVSCRGGTDGTVAATASGGSGAYTFQWSNGSDLAQQGDLTSREYMVTVTDGNGCTISDSVFISEPDTELTLMLTDSVAGCFGSSASSRTARATGGLAPYTFLWSSGETDTTAVRLPAGDQSVRVTDAGGCTKIIEFTIENRPVPQPTIVVAGEDKCDATAQQYLTVEPGFTAFQWSTGDTTSRIAVTPGERDYAVTVTDAAGCSGTASYRYTPPRPVVFDVTATPVSCFGARDGGLRISNLSGPGGTMNDYQLVWGASADFASGPAITDRPAGAYKLTLTDSSGCSIDTTLLISSPDLLVVTGQATDAGCTGQADGAITTSVSGGTGAYDFRWSTGARGADLVGLAAGTYTVTVTDGGGCQATAEFILEESSPISVETTTVPATCGGEASGRIDIAASGGRAPLTYSLDNEVFSNAPSLIGIGAGTYIIYVRDVAGCTSQDTITVEDPPAITVDLGDDIEIVFGDSLTLVPDVSDSGTGQIDYRWSATYPGTLSCTDCRDPVAKPTYEITYTLSVMDGLGCEGEDQLRVKVRKIREVAVPTGFSPNGDGRNDRLLVHGRPGTRVITLAVYDRWGGLLFEDGDFSVNDPDRGWDGTGRDGTPLNAGVYLYKLRIEYEDRSQELLSGHTTLIR
ncbi:gliding motility-associated-like protein [Lewinella aquimaris]|uniref:Gliding motility-associated-like protein n=1 Tax=Neolewinella aquimaris TaxID=1835722 RepID=A0A840E2A1_9BACT|nr:proprotein convertase P-domain-containing protein [Neolewinella aquimaris]MBB4078083.1 gliding motility-associated-like protein [Neolewinella aquimaris]